MWNGGMGECGMEGLVSDLDSIRAGKKWLLINDRPCQPAQLYFVRLYVWWLHACNKYMYIHVIKLGSTLSPLEVHEEFLPGHTSAFNLHAPSHEGQVLSQVVPSLQRDESLFQSLPAMPTAHHEQT